MICNFSFWAKVGCFSKLREEFRFISFGWEQVTRGYMKIRGCGKGGCWSIWIKIYCMDCVICRNMTWKTGRTGFWNASATQYMPLNCAEPWLQIRTYILIHCCILVQYDTVGPLDHSVASALFWIFFEESVYLGGTQRLFYFWLYTWGYSILIQYIVCTLYLILFTKYIVLS